MQPQYPQRRNANIIVMDLDGEVLVYDERTNKAFCLNETSALVWELCDGQHSLSEISRSVGEKLNAAVDDGLVWLALEQLRQADLVEHEAVQPDSLVGLSRRQAIRKIGLTAMITLPLISSLVAPTPAHAASASPVAPIVTPFVPPVAPVFAPAPVVAPGSGPRPLAPVVPPNIAPAPVVAPGTPHPPSPVARRPIIAPVR